MLCRSPHTTLKYLVMQVLDLPHIVVHVYTHACEYIQRINQGDISVLRVPPYLRLLGNHLKKTDENHRKFFLDCIKSSLRELWNELAETLEHLPPSAGCTSVKK